MSNQEVPNPNPMIPNSGWRMNDLERPQPKIITPGNVCQLPPVTPPSDAIILFDGSSTDEWVHSGKNRRPCEWEIVNETLRVVPKTWDIETKKVFGNCQLHLEWMAPTIITGPGQKRGNSGVFMMGEYEIQVLDDYDNPTYADGLCCAIYGQKPPLVNSSCKPGEWHIYDILWTAPIFENENLIRPAYVTMLHNGVVVHNHQVLLGRTVGKILEYYPHAPKGPIKLQDHGDLVSFRNIWVREI